MRSVVQTGAPGDMRRCTSRKAMTMTEDEVRQHLDEMCELHGGSEDISRIYDYERNHQERVLKEWGRFVSQFELFFDLLNNMLVGINFVRKDNWPEHRNLQYLLCANNARFFYNSFDRLIKGHATESMVLSRPLFETFIRITYASCYPSSADAVLAPIKRSDGVKFRLTNFMRDDLGLNWMTYKLWSAFTHSNSYGVFKDLRAIRNGEKRLICMHLDADQRECEMAMNLLLFVAITFLRAIYQLLVTSFNDHLKEEEVQQAVRLGELWQASMRLHPKEHWPQVMDDLDYVFEVLKAAESGRDWHVLAAKHKQQAEGS